VGFLAGYITDAQVNWNAHQKSAQTAATPSAMPPALRQRFRNWRETEIGAVEWI